MEIQAKTFRYKDTSVMYVQEEHANAMKAVNEWMSTVYSNKDYDVRLISFETLCNSSGDQYALRVYYTKTQSLLGYAAGKYEAEQKKEKEAQGNSDSFEPVNIHLQRRIRARFACGLFLILSSITLPILAVKNYQNTVDAVINGGALPSIALFIVIAVASVFALIGFRRF